MPIPNAMIVADAEEVSLHEVDVTLPLSWWVELLHDTCCAMSERDTPMTPNQLLDVMVLLRQVLKHPQTLLRQVQQPVTFLRIVRPMEGAPHRLCVSDNDHPFWSLERIILQLRRFWTTECGLAFYRADGMYSMFKIGLTPAQGYRLRQEWTMAEDDDWKR